MSDDELWELLHASTTEVPVSLQLLLREVVQSLTLMQAGKASSIGGNEIARLKPASGPPRPVEDLAGMVVKDFLAATSNAGRLRVIKDGQELVTSLRFAPVQEGIGLRRGTLDWKIAVATDARSVAVVAQVFGLDARQVRAWRRRYGNGRDEETAA